MSDLGAGRASDLGTGRASVGLVLDAAWGAGVFTATDAMATAGLTRSTAIEAIDTLLRARVLCELPNARDAGEYRAGRPARRFVLPDDLGLVVGLDSGDEHLDVRVTDLAGGVRAASRHTLGGRQSVEQRRASILAAVDAAIAEAGAGGGAGSAGSARVPVLALCAGVAAPTDRAGVSPPHPQGFWQRTNPGLIELLGDRAQVVAVKNDAQLASTAEGARGEAVDCRDYVALLAGERLGAGVVVDGHLLHGAHGGVGEMFAFDVVEGIGSAIGLGPLLESRASGALEGLGARRILALAADGDPAALAVARDVGDSLARIVGVLGSMFDPQRVVVCGAIAEGIEPVLVAARAALPDHIHLPAPVLTRSRLGADIVTEGAVAHALECARRVTLPALAEDRLREIAA